MTAAQIRHADLSDQQAVVEVLANAFASDPVLNWLMRSPADPEQRLVHMFGAFIQAELTKDVHAVDVVDGGGAAAVWHEVDDWQVPNRQIARSFPALVRTFGRGLPRALRALTMIDKVHPEEPHLHLGFIGVHVDRQGQGLGGALLESMTERCDTEGLGAYLENSNERNEPLYARYGFESRGAIVLPSGAPPLLAMWRDPR